MKFLRKWGILLVTIIFVAIIAVLCLLGYQSIEEYKATIATQQANNDKLTSFIDNDIGPLVNVYVVNQAVRVGDTITEEMLSPVSIPEKIAYSTEMVDVEMTDDKGNTYIEQQPEKVLKLVTSLNDVVGRKFRVALDEGSVLNSDFVVDETLQNSERYYEIVLEDFPTNITVGDYVDIRITFTYGEDFIALPHMRVEDMDLARGMFTFIFDENDIGIYNSMLLDKAMYEAVNIYALSYVDSSSQTSAESYYPINKNISEILAINPNILELVKEEMELERAQLNAMMGGEVSTFDERRLNQVEKSITDMRRDLAKDKVNNVRERIRAEEAAAKAAAKANKG